MDKEYEKSLTEDYGVTVEDVENMDSVLQLSLGEFLNRYQPAENERAVLSKFVGFTNKLLTNNVTGILHVPQGIALTLINGATVTLVNNAPYDSGSIKSKDSFPISAPPRKQGMDISFNDSFPI